jgi:hypothetical protein
MLELRPCCENCNKPLPYNARNAMICSLECTFCENCVNDFLKNVCPNCGGGFSRRPLRPENQLHQYPASTKNVYNRVDLDKHNEKLAKLKALPEVKVPLQY